MKKILLIIATVAFLNSYSQTEKGKKFIGASINLMGYNHNYSDTAITNITKGYGYQITTSLGLFIKDNLAIGISPYYTNDNSTVDLKITTPKHYGLTSSNTTTIYGGGIFARYYKKIINNLYFSATAALSYNYETFKYNWTSYNPHYIYFPTDPQNQQSIANNMSASIVPALEYFLTPKLGIRTDWGDLYYIHSITKNTTFDNNNKQVNNNYGLSLNLSTFSLGMYYYF